MIPERGARVAQRHTELSPLPPVTRRAFLTLTAAAVVAGCAPPHSSASARHVAQRHRLCRASIQQFQLCAGI